MLCQVENSRPRKHPSASKALEDVIPLIHDPEARRSNPWGVALVLEAPDKACARATGRPQWIWSGFTLKARLARGVPDCPNGELRLEIVQLASCRPDSYGAMMVVSTVSTDGYGTVQSRPAASNQPRFV